MKKLISLLLSITMLLSMTAGLDFSAYAATELESSGECGSDTYYTYNASTGKLVIYGSGEIGAFYDDDGYAVSLFEGFQGQNITEVIIREGVEGICGDVFLYCTLLKSVTLPSTLTFIGEGAFECCYCLNNVVIPKSVTTISGNPFPYCSSLMNLQVEEGNPCFSDYGHQLLVNTKTNTLIRSGVGETYIPDGIVHIGDYACENTKRYEFYIPESVETIGIKAFKCNYFKLLSIPDSVKEIGDSAFQSCYINTVVIGKGVEKINLQAFDNNNISDFIVSDQNPYFTSENSVLFNKDKSELIQFPSNSRLTEYTVPSSVTKIEQYAFCDSPLVNVTIPDSVVDIGRFAFLWSKNLKSIAFPRSLKTLNSGVIQQCRALESVTFSTNIQYIDCFNFSDCASLTDIYYEGTEKQWNDLFIVMSGNDDINTAKMHYATEYNSYPFQYILTESGAAEITGCIGSEPELTIPSELDGYPVVSIGPNAFRDNTTLTTVDFQAPSLQKISAYAFNGCQALSAIAIPDSVKEVGDYAFARCAALKTVRFGKGLTAIADDLFFGCSGLSHLVIPNTITSIGVNAFFDSGLEDVTIQNGVRTIDSYAFSYCDFLTVVRLGNGIQTIRPDAFFNSPVKDIYYNGSEADWNNVVRHGNAFYDATMHYNSIPECDEHTWDSGKVTTKPACTKTGVKTYTCKECGKKMTESIPATGHKEVIDAAVTPTCTESGSTQGKHCTVCGATTVAQKTIPAAGHRYADYEITPSTCMQTGSIESVCTVCGDTVIVPTAPLGHQWNSGQITKPATESATGIKTYTCLRCGETKTEAIPKIVIKNGWKIEGGKWHYFTNNVAVTGWQKISSKWYLFNRSGVMLTGWQKSGGKWYYFNSSGAMVTGWQKIGGKWYLFNSSGAMLTGWQKSGGSWYYFNSSGAMVTGWQKISGKWYYFNSSGAMRTASLKQGGKTYYFNASGACTNP